MRNRRGCVIRCHKDGSEQQTAGQKLTEHPVEKVVAAAWEEHCQNGDRRKIRRRNPPGDDLANQEVSSADEQCRRGNLTETSAASAQKQLQNAAIRQRAGSQRLHRRGRADGIEQLDLMIRTRGHCARPAEHHKRSCRQRGVDNVHADSAEELLDNHNGKEISDQNHPVGHIRRTHKRNQHARNNRRPVSDRAVLFHHPAVAPFKEHAAHHGKRRERQHSPAEQDDRRNQRRHKRDTHVAHNDRRGIAAVRVR